MKNNNIEIEAFIVEGCYYCSALISNLEKRKIKFEKIIVPYHKKDEYKDKHQHYTFPHVFININKKRIFIGGYEDYNNLMELCNFLNDKKITLKQIAEICESFI